MTSYVSSVKAEVDELGGIAKIFVENEEIINENEAKVSLVFVCKKEDAQIHKTYILRKVNSTWKIATDKL